MAKFCPCTVHAGLAREFARLDVAMRARLEIVNSRAADVLSAFRGLTVSADEAVHALDDRDRAWAESFERSFTEPFEPPAENTPLGMLTRSASLGAVEVEALLLALAPELDPAYSRIFALLDDDVTRRGPSVGLALSLLAPGRPLWVSRSAFSPSSTLARLNLLVPTPKAGEPESLVSRSLILDDRVAEFLFGLDGFDQRLRPLASMAVLKSRDEMSVEPQVLDALKAWRDGRPAPRFAIIADSDPSMAESACIEAGLPLMVVDLGNSTTPVDDELVRLIWREALFQGSAVLFKLGLTGAGIPSGLSAWLRDPPADRPVFIAANQARDVAAIVGPKWIVCRPPAPSRRQQRQWWAAALNVPESDALLETLPLLDSLRPAAIAEIAAEFRMTPGADELHLRKLCLDAQPGGVPGVRRITPVRTAKDLVLPADTRAMLAEYRDQAAHRGTVLGAWGFDAHLSGGKGLVALFVGPPGSGKTLAAEVLATELGRELWQIDLAQIVSKYIGETEKNLEAVFRAAASGPVLFFDEADALFGKRTEVNDAHDRYANQEVSYLLQRIDAHSGITILASNLRQNIDESFTRRLNFLVEFPFPDDQDRRVIWDAVFPRLLPVGPDVDFDRLAREVRLTGGHIRNITLAAAYLAAAEGEPIRMGHLWRAVAREYQKLGRTWQTPTHSPSR